MYYIDSYRGNTYIYRNTCMCVYVSPRSPALFFIPALFNQYILIFLFMSSYGLCKILQLSKGVLNGEALFFLIT